MFVYELSGSEFESSCSHLDFASSVKQGHPGQSVTCDFLIYKKGYQETLKIFTYTPHPSPFQIYKKDTREY